MAKAPEEDGDQPLYLTRLADQLASETGVPVSIVPDSQGHWIVYLDGERIQLEAHYRHVQGTGAWITIDGVTSRFLGDPEEFLRVWHGQSVFRDGFVDPPPLEADAVIPAVAQQLAAILRAKMGQSPVTSFNGDYWTISLLLGTTRLRLFIIKHKGRWNLAGNGGFNLVADGEDVTDKCGGSLEAAMRMALLAQSGAAGSQGTSDVGRASAASSNSVRVRRASVYRV